MILSPSVINRYHYLPDLVLQWQPAVQTLLPPQRPGLGQYRTSTDFSSVDFTIDVK